MDGGDAHGRRWSDAALRRAGLATFVAAVTLTLVGVALQQGVAGRPGLAHPEVTSREDVAVLLYGLAMAASGLLVTWYRPRNSVGWWLFAAALLEVLCDSLQAYGARALVLDPRLPLGEAALSVGAPLWVPAVAIPVTCLLLRYPTGDLTGRWARRVDRGVLIGMVLLWVGYAGSVSSVTDEVKGHEPPVLLPEPVSGALMLPAGLLILGGVLFTLVHTVVRTLRATYPERQQLALLVAIGPVAAFLLLTPWEWTQKLFFGIPFAVVIGVFRYKLLGIEVVVRRTLLYGLLTGMVLLVFVAITASLSNVLPSGAFPEVVAAGLVAVGVVPLRDRLQRGVDRFVYGDRGDPLAALRRLGSPLGLTADEALLPEVLTAITASVRVPGAEILGEGGTRASVGLVGDATVDVPLVMGGSTVGVLRLAARAGETQLPAPDRRLVEALAPLVAAVLHAVELAAALQVEQERVVAATETERARLRQELHDGLGPSLTGIGLGLEALESRVGASDLVDRLRAETATSLEEVRRIIDGLRPGALESADLLSLLRIRAQHLSATTPVRVSVVAPEQLPVLPPEVEGAALRIAEEALTNVVKHAGATTCAVIVSLDEALRLEIRDDGRGYDGPRVGGVGVASMRTRAERLGGTCSVSATASGTAVIVELPLIGASAPATAGTA
ncbi:MAG TPA: histidine kinase [Mycobacteriales bacterium]|nr:histidine kinase [Mycobacteriales bacterium]